MLKRYFLMTVSNVSGWVFGFLLAAYFVGQTAQAVPLADIQADESRVLPSPRLTNGRLAQVQTGQDPSKPLPSVNLAPAPASKPPSVMQRRLPPRPKPIQDRNRTLKLRVDPDSGRALTAQELRQRDDQQSGKQGPTRLLLPRGDGKAAAGANEEVKEGDISVRTLDVIGVDSIGLLNPDGQGFPEHMWQGAPYALVSRLMNGIPVTAPSATMRSLAWRLLLSTATAPVGGDAKSELFATRLERVAAAGWHEQVLAMLQQVPDGPEGPAFASYRLQSLLALGREDEACALVRQQIEHTEEPGWQMAMAYCFARAGESAKLELYETLLHESGIEDPFFFLLLGRLKGDGDEKIEKTGDITALHAAMIAAAGGKLPAKLAGAVPAGLMARFSAIEKVPYEIRVSAAEHAGVLGLIAPDQLAAIYEAGKFEADEIKNPMAALKRHSGATAMALIYQAVLGARDPVDTATYIAAALRLARKRGVYSASAAIYRPMIVNIPVTPGLAWFAAEAGRVFLHHGDLASARRWMVAAGPAARQGDADAVGAILELTPLLYVGARKTEMPVVESALKGWWRAEVASGRENRYRRAAVFFTLLDVFDRQVPGELWENLLDGPDSVIREPSPGTQAKLRQAVAGGQLGESVMFSLLAFGDKGPGGVSTDLLAQVVGGLLSFGLREDAQRLALEIMIAEGF